MSQFSMFSVLTWLNVGLCNVNLYPNPQDRVNENLEIQLSVLLLMYCTVLHLFIYFAIFWTCLPYNVYGDLETNLYHYLCL